MDESYRFEEIPLDYKHLFEMWLQRITWQEDSFNLSCDDIKAQMQYQNRDNMNDEEIGGLMPFRNIDDLMRIGPMSINSSPWYDIAVMGTFSYHGLDYLVYQLDYSFNGDVIVLACLSKNSDYPPSLIIAGGTVDSRYASFSIDTLKNEISISRIFCCEFVTKKISRYRLDNFDLIDERYLRNLSTDSIRERFHKGYGIDVDSDELGNWIEID